MAGGQMVNDLLEVNLHTVLFGRDIDVSLFVDAEIIDSPTLDIVEFLGVFNTPLFHASILFLNS